MARDSNELLDFFVVPSGYLTPGKFEALVGPNARDLAMFQHPDLRVLLELASNVSLMHAISLLSGQPGGQPFMHQRRVPVPDVVDSRHRVRMKPSRPLRITRIQLAMQQQVSKAADLSARMAQRQQLGVHNASRRVHRAGLDADKTC